MRAMFYRIHSGTPGDLCVYVCDQDCRVRDMLYPIHACTPGDLSLSLSLSLRPRKRRKKSQGAQKVKCVEYNGRR